MLRGESHHHGTRQASGPENAPAGFLLKAMCVRPLKSDSVTAASIYHAVDREHSTLLIDEGDRHGLLRLLSVVYRRVLITVHKGGRNAKDVDLAGEFCRCRVISG
jgi:hypothetical protein